ncbi:NAD(P)-binding protein [Mycena crocata]|nr:NAD(P)-binding protein [Mycena crocata]
MSSSIPSTAKIVLVLLATGKQGGGVVRALARANQAAPEGAEPWLILAQTRDPTSAKSVSLAALRGVRLHKGGPDDPAALFSSAPGPVYGVFSVQLSMDNPGGVKLEVVQANALADAAAKHGVKHFVYSSVNFGAVPEKCYVPHFQSKRYTEAYLKLTHPKLPTTILRPVTFMDEVAGPDTLLGRVIKLMFLTQLDPNVRLHFVAVSDIGEMAALALQNPDKYLGRTIDLAGDVLNRKELAVVWREVFGEDLRPNQWGGNFLAWAARLADTEIRLMFKFFNEMGFRADIPTLRAEYPGLKDFRTFLRTE